MTSPEYVRVCSWASLGWEHGQVEVPGVDDQKRWASTSQAHRSQAALVMTVTCLLNLTLIVAWWNILLETDKTILMIYESFFVLWLSSFHMYLTCVTYDVCRVTLMAVCFYEMSPWRRRYSADGNVLWRLLQEWVRRTQRKSTSPRPPRPSPNTASNNKRADVEPLLLTSTAICSWSVSLFVAFHCYEIELCDVYTVVSCIIRRLKVIMYMNAQISLCKQLGLNCLHWRTSDAFPWRHDSSHHFPAT